MTPGILAQATRWMELAFINIAQNKGGWLKFQTCWVWDACEVSGWGYQVSSCIYGSETQGRDRKKKCLTCWNKNDT